MTATCHYCDCAIKQTEAGWVDGQGFQLCDKAPIQTTGVHLFRSARHEPETGQ